MSKFIEQIFAHNKFAHFVGCEQFFADVSSKIIALANPILSQPDMEREMVSPPAGAYIASFTIYHVLPDLPAVPETGYCLFIGSSVLAQCRHSACLSLVAGAFRNRTIPSCHRPRCQLSVVNSQVNSQHSTKESWPYD